MKVYIVWYTGYGSRGIEDIFLTLTSAEKCVDRMAADEFEEGDTLNYCTWSYGKEIIKSDFTTHSWIVSERYVNEEIA